MNDAWRDILIDLVAATIFFCLGLIVSRLPRSIKKYRFRKFFGAPLLGKDVNVVYGVYFSLPSKRKASSIQSSGMQKVYSDGTVFKFPVISKAVTPGLVRAYSYIVQEVGRFRKEPLNLCTDVDAIKNLNCTFISIGGPLTNEMTRLILDEKNNTYLRFEDIDDSNKDNWTLSSLQEGRSSASFRQKDGKDYGAILKIRNSRFPKHHLFVCAGIGARGVSGAAWYLSYHWDSLYKEFKSGEFGIVLEVSQGSDTSAVRIVSSQNNHIDAAR